MNLIRNGITISVSDNEVARIVLERLNGSAYADSLRGMAVPRIGQYWTGQGGIYAGVMRGRELGAADYHLIVGPEAQEAATWDWCTDWSKTVTVDGHTDFTLHFRRELSLCFANVPELFKPVAYWSCEQHESYSSSAYFQSFSHGLQSHWSKRGKLLARAVRRLIIQ